MGLTNKNGHPGALTTMTHPRNKDAKAKSDAMTSPMPSRPRALLPPISLDAFRQLAATSLRADPPAAPEGPSDYDLNPGLEREFPKASTPRPAAVLVPVIARTPLTMLFTQRTDALPSHAGQIAFPGGKVEPSDRNVVETAQREAEEEIGLDRALTEPLGYLDPYLTGTGFRIIPVVAVVQPHFKLKLDPSEVAAAFEVPFDFLMNAENHQRHSRTFRGQERFYHAMPYEDRYIWGATAGILKNMYGRFFPK